MIRTAKVTVVAYLEMVNGEPKVEYATIARVTETDTKKRDKAIAKALGKSVTVVSTEDRLHEYKMNDTFFFANAELVSDTVDTDEFDN